MLLDDILVCPTRKAFDGSEIPLLKKESGTHYVNNGYEYPVVGGVLNAKLVFDQDGITSYDDVLESFSFSTRDLTSVLKINDLSIEEIQGKDILLAGTGGGGDLSWLIQAKPRTIVALDYSPHIVNIANRYKDHTNIRFLIGDICDLPFKKQSFDLVISYGIIQHTRSPELAFSDLCRVLRPSGVLSIAALYAPSEHNYMVDLCRSKFLLHEEENREKAKKCIRYHTLFYMFLMYTGLWRINRKLKLSFTLWQSNIPGYGYSDYYSNAEDYYLVKYRHLVSRSEVRFWSDRLGVKYNDTPKGYKIIKSA